MSDFNKNTLEEDIYKSSFSCKNHGKYDELRKRNWGKSENNPTKNQL